MGCCKELTDEEINKNNDECNECAKKTLEIKPNQFTTAKTPSAYQDRLKAIDLKMQKVQELEQKQRQENQTKANQRGMRM